MKAMRYKKIWVGNKEWIVGLFEHPNNNSLSHFISLVPLPILHPSPKYSCDIYLSNKNYFLFVLYFHSSLDWYLEPSHH
jgi:hypothetical protein